MMVKKVSKPKSVSGKFIACCSRAFLSLNCASALQRESYDRMYLTVHTILVLAVFFCKTILKDSCRIWTVRYLLGWDHSSVFLHLY